MYNHAPENYICPFCLIVHGTQHNDNLSVQSDVIYHDNRVTAFVSLYQWPNNHGNIVVIPNEHYENIYDLPILYASDIHHIAKRIALAMKLAFCCDGISTRQHNEPAGNQDLWHYHLHVTPRYNNDQFNIAHREIMSVSERAKLADKLKDCLARQSKDSFMG